jgi:pimeloyl-ACP methyl ester carboxylesterase
MGIQGGGEVISLRAGELELAACRWGPPDGRRVLALHGWLDNAGSFAPLAARLQGVSLVALELPGHGRSAWRPAGNAYHFIDNVADVVAAADALGWERFTLLGHSLGAAVASFIAAALPERVEQLLLLEGVGPLSGLPEEETGRLRRYLRQCASLGRKRRRYYPNLEAAAAQRAANGDLSIEAAAVLAGRGTAKVEGQGWYWCHDPRLTFTSPHYYSEEQVLGVLRSIEVPAALLLGEAGLLHQRPTTEARCQAIAGLVRQTLPGGHHLHMESPERVAAVVQRWLAQQREVMR